jgi:Zn-finger nucleic acid-binding protein
MKCPACSSSLEEQTVGEVIVDVCKKGCGGIWFDEGELKKFDEPHEFTGELILTSNRTPPQAKNGARDCPKCDESAYLIKRYYSPNGKYEIDQCSKCSGIWLDVGELATIRNEYQTEKARQEAGDKLLDSHLTPLLNNINHRVSATEKEIDINRQSNTFSKIIKSLIS